MKTLSQTYLTRYLLRVIAASLLFSFGASATSVGFAADDEQTW